MWCTIIAKVGFGLGYTSWEISDASTDGFVDGQITLPVTLANTGERAGSHVVQVYAERPDSVVDRPTRWLVGFAAVAANAGETVEVAIPVPERALAYWENGWQLEAGEYTLRIGSSVLDLPGSVSVSIWRPP